MAYRKVLHSALVKVDEIHVVFLFVRVYLVHKESILLGPCNYVSESKKEKKEIPLVHTLVSFFRMLMVMPMFRFRFCLMMSFKIEDTLILGAGSLPSA